MTKIVCWVLVLLPLVSSTLDPSSVPKYENDLWVPPAMPAVSKDYYEIAVRQFQQHMLPPSMNLSTTVWGYGSPHVSGVCGAAGSFCTPGSTIDVQEGVPVTIKWINDLRNRDGTHIPPIGPVDQTIHWANPAGPVDTAGTSQEPYRGPVPLVPHVHGAHTTDDSDGFPEAWFLPRGCFHGYAPVGSKYEYFRSRAQYGHQWGNGSVVYYYRNDQPPATLWYHDHALGITRLNAYSGLVGMYIIRGKDNDIEGTFPGPARGVQDPQDGTFYEIPLIIQDRKFSEDGSLYYPPNRKAFDALEDELEAGAALDIPFIPDTTCDGNKSDVHPLWGPEFFGDTILVNGRAWPKLEVAPVRYRFRILNACNARFLILKLNHTGLNFWVIAADRGYIHQRAASVDQVLVGPSERIDVIIDFANVSGENILLQNVGPDEPLGGDKPDPADSDSTGQVMLFSVVLPQVQDQSTPPNQLILPNITRLTTSSCTKIRKLSITEQNSTSVRMRQDSDKSVHLDCSADDFYGPIRSLLGTYQGNGTDGKANPLMWSDPTTEIMKPGVTEIWEIYDLSEDAHPIHIHQVGFQVLKRVPFDDSEEATDPEPWETGYKDTVIVYPDQLTRIAIKPDIEGLFVWHCHMLEHEDNEMMRPLVIRRQQ